MQYYSRGYSMGLPVPETSKVSTARTCCSVSGHLHVHSSRNDFAVRFLIVVFRLTGDRSKHCSRAAGLLIHGPRALGACLKRERIRLHHPVLAKTVERVMKAVQCLDVRVAQGKTYKTTYSKLMPIIINCFYLMLLTCKKQ